MYLQLENETASFIMKVTNIGDNKFITDPQPLKIFLQSLKEDYDFKDMDEEVVDMILLGIQEVKYEIIKLALEQLNCTHPNPSLKIHTKTYYYSDFQE